MEVNPYKKRLRTKTVKKIEPRAGPSNGGQLRYPIVALYEAESRPVGKSILRCNNVAVSERSDIPSPRLRYKSLAKKALTDPNQASTSTALKRANEVMHLRNHADHDEKEGCTCKIAKIDVTKIQRSAPVADAAAIPLVRIGGITNKKSVPENIAVLSNVIIGR